ncbi:hypothetical protein KAI92_03430 [Candidatus Parcubacteria bacterium]|nr:hypothetical protein [Candidatus Parcubacteria bacterium]
MNKNFLTIACLVMITITLSSCSLLGGDKEGKENIDNKKTTEKSKTKESKKSINEDSKDNDGKDGNYFETMEDLMKRGKTMKCTYTQEIEDGPTASGIIYMSDGNARTEITMNEGTDRVGKMYAITDQDWVYSWTESSPKGFKMTKEASEMSKENKETISDMTDEIDFTCKSWKKDSSKFKAPTGIVFEDMSEMLEDFADMDLEKEIEDAEAMGHEFICNHCKNAPDPEDCLGGIVCDWSK